MSPLPPIRPKPPEGLWQPDFARRVGLGERTLSSWRRRGLPVGNPVPAPDGRAPDRAYLRPWWWPATADAWQARRPLVGGPSG